MRRRTAIILAVSALAVVGLSALGIYVIGKAMTPNLVLRFNRFYYLNIRGQWEGRIREVGTEQAHREVKERMAGASTEIAHGVMHVFGELVYEADGLAGLRICDASFNYGCYHGFMNWAINYEGPGAVAEISRRCVDLYGDHELFCRHGIGHGLFDHFGRDKIAFAFDECRKIGSTSLMGCYNGVMMELVSGEGFSEDFLVMDRPYDLCTGLDPDYRQACYFHMTYWWNWRTKNDARKVVALCDGIVDPGERDACRMGAGKTFAELTGYDARKAAKYCDKMPDPDRRMRCHAGARWVFVAASRDPGGLCVPLDDGRRSACMAIAETVGYDTPEQIRRAALGASQ